jgi:glycosyltransferase involved in cell wall biosynthesis
MSAIELSIIVPVYNTQEFLEKCLGSLVVQQITNFEIIIINDGSTDNSLIVAQEFKSKYPALVHCYSKENGGLSDARNFGLTKAQGEFVAFVDSDDLVDCTMFSKMLSKAKRTHSEIVFCDFDVLNKDAEWIMHWSAGNCPDEGLVLSENPEFLCEILPSACNKIYKRILFKDTENQFDKGIWYEDFALIPYLMAISNRIAQVKEPLYKYMKRDNSITNTYSSKVLDGLTSYQLLKARFTKNDLGIKYASPLSSMLLTMISATIIRIFKAPKLFLISEDIKEVKNVLARIDNDWQNKPESSRLNFIQRLVLLSLKYNLSIPMALIYKLKIKIHDRGL